MLLRGTEKGDARSFEFLGQGRAKKKKWHYMRQRVLSAHPGGGGKGGCMQTAQGGEEGGVACPDGASICPGSLAEKGRRGGSYLIRNQSVTRGGGEKK